MYNYIIIISIYNLSPFGCFLIVHQFMPLDLSVPASRIKTESRKRTGDVIKIPGNSFCLWILLPITALALSRVVLKTPKKPNFPQGKDPSSLDQLRQAIVEEVKKAEKNLPLIRKLMETTFPLRRQTIVMSCPPLKELLDLWPALKMESEVIWISSL